MVATRGAGWGQRGVGGLPDQRITAPANVFTDNRRRTRRLLMHDDRQGGKETGNPSEPEPQREVRGGLPGVHR